jgi:hypothetical protein
MKASTNSIQKYPIENKFNIEPCEIVKNNLINYEKDKDLINENEIKMKKSLTNMTFMIKTVINL